MKVEEKVQVGSIMSLHNGQLNQGFEMEIDNSDFSNLRHNMKQGVGSVKSSVVTLNLNNSESTNTQQNLSSNTHTANVKDVYHHSKVSTVEPNVEGSMSQPCIHHIIVDLSCASFIDTSGVQILLQVNYSSIHKYFVCFFFTIFC